MRLDKYLTEMGLGSRSEVKQGIRKGFARVNETTVTRPEYRVLDSNKVYWKGTLVTFVEYEYIMLNKPAGVVSATEDSKDRTVIDLIKDSRRRDLFPVGRLDKDTEGLLLLTNDGKLAHKLLSPRRHVAKVYYARIQGVMTSEDVKRFAEGLYVDEALTALPAELEILALYPKDSETRTGEGAGDAAPAETGGTSEGISEIRLKIYEGKFHQVKRMVQAVGKEVIYLKRLSMGSLVLDEKLRPGEYRVLTTSELEELYAE